jgi:hypothetical protein
MSPGVHRPPEIEAWGISDELADFIKKRADPSIHRDLRPRSLLVAAEGSDSRERGCVCKPRRVAPRYQIRGDLPVPVTAQFSSSSRAPVAVEVTFDPAI